MNQISFVYFDVGGVVIRDFSGTDMWQDLKTGLGISLDQGTQFDAWFDQVSLEVCDGKDLESFVPQMISKFDLKLTEDFNFLSEFVDRFARNESIWPIVDLARSKYKIGLLTNMYLGMLDMICERGLMPQINWDVIIDSSVEGVSKPEKAIYELAQQRARVNPEEILFVDNTQGHLDAAANLGWQTYLYKGEDSSSTQNLEHALFRK